MQPRIYFLLVIFAAVAVAVYQNGTITSLHNENAALKQSLEEQRRIARSGPESSGIGRGDQYEKAIPSPEHLNYTTTAIEGKISLMERQLKRYRHETDAYQSMISALKDEIEIRERELQDIRDRFAQYEVRHETFIDHLTEKEQDLEAAIASVRAKRDETGLLGKKVKELSHDLSRAEAEACYAKAQLTELAGNKILFSRERRKEHFREALEGYRKAFSLGKEEARENIFRLEKSLFPALATVQ